jgi:hypothetical protein
MCIFYFRYFDVLKTGVIALKNGPKKLFLSPYEKNCTLNIATKKDD